MSSDAYPKASVNCLVIEWNLPWTKRANEELDRAGRHERDREGVVMKERERGGGLR